MSSEPNIFKRWWSTRDSRLALFAGCFLFIVTLAVYWPVIHYPFINYDDGVYVAEKVQVQSGLTAQAVLWAFTNIEAAFWHPLTWLSHMLDCQIYGLNAGGHHLTSLLIHIANTLLLFAVLRRMTATLWRSAFVAALFALHPLHVESVAWVAERKDVLSTFFFMLTLWAYARFVGESKVQSPKSRVFYALSLALFALGLMSKPTYVTLPFVLLLLDYWPLQRLQLSTARRLLWEKLPFFAMTVAACTLVFYSEHKAGAVRTLTEIPPAFRLANAVISYASYLRKMIWPDDLAIFYPYPNVFSVLQVVTLLLLLAAVTIGVVAMHRRRPYLAVGWLWYLGMLVPVIGLVPVGGHAMADRFTYVPVIGCFVMIAWGVTELLSRRAYGGVILGLGAATALAGCVIATAFQVRYWRSNSELFEHALTVTKNNVVAHCHIAMALMEQGKEAEAAQHYAAALRINPSYIDVNYNLGNFHRRQGRLDEAASYYLAELRVRPRHALARNNLGIVLATQKKTDEAIECFKAALEIRPDYADAHNNLANLLAAKGQVAEAMAQYLATLRLQPEHAEARLNLARLFEQQNQLAEAAEHLTAALSLRPRDADAHKRLASVLGRQGKTNEAAVHEQEVSRILREQAAALNDQGLALVKQRKADEAIALFNHALQDGADPADTHKNLGLAFSLKGNVTESIAHYREAVRLRPDSVEALNNLAWTLATHKEAGARNGLEAVRLAERAAQLTKHNDAPTLDTLAAAYAEAGRFTEAVKTAQDALDDAQTEGRTEMASQIRERLKLYQAQRAFRE